MKINFITSNVHKVEELQEQVSDIDLEVIHLKMKYPEIQADNILDVARFSLSSLIPSISGDFLIEDAGIVIEGLNGFPGPYSSFVFSTIANKGILDLMSDIENREAKFVSVMALYWEGDTYFFQGECNGKISNQLRGTKGFGFDPIFIPDGYSSTFGEMDIEEKTKISHRSKSIALLLDFLKKHEQN